jgi:low density lipoprotein-related protein 2
LCASLGCEFSCRPSLEGGACSCPIGKKVGNDSRSCIDRNECEEWEVQSCDQKCENTDGSYQCTCVEGYELHDRTHCEAKKSLTKMRLYFTHTDMIYSMDLDKNRVDIANATEASGLDFHFKRKLLFFTDTNKRKVYQLRLDETGTKTISKRDYSVPGAWSPVAVAVDWISSNLYVVDSLGQKIDIFDLEGDYHAIVMSSNLTAPTDIALDPKVGLMFITDNNRILRAHMDGSLVKTLVTDAVYKASGIAVDLVAKRIYWSDILLDYIETVDYNRLRRQRHRYHY